MSAASFPVFDLCCFERAGSEGRQRLGRDVDVSCRSTGFLAISNHSVPQATVDAVYPAAHDFFNLPAGLTDPEALAFCFAQAVWPAKPTGFADAWKPIIAPWKGSLREKANPHMWAACAIAWHRPRNSHHLAATLRPDR